LAHAAASPLFWQFWDELLNRELAQWTKTVSDDDRQAEWPPQFRSALTCLFLWVFWEQQRVVLRVLELLIPSRD
jgi:hypothetical protein